MDITVPYTPRPWTKALHDSKKRWIVLVIHRRAGKTTAALNHLQRDAVTKAKTRYAYVAPTYKQAKAIAWDIIKHCSRVIPGIEYNEAELTVRYPNGSRITLYGADNPDSLRGIGLWGVVFDEYSQQPSNIFTEIIRPALADHGGYAIWIGTPKGKNEFFRLYEQGKKDTDWLSLLLTVDETKTIARKEIEDAKKVMTPDEFEQEWYCSFEAAIKGAYYSREISEARKKGRIKHVPYDPELPVYDVWDLGVGTRLGVGLYQKAGRELHMIGYEEGQEDEGITQMIKRLKDKPYIYGKHFAPHDIKAKEIATGKTRFDTAKALGWEFQIIPGLSVDDGISKGRLMFSRLWVDEQNCSQWLDYISQYQQVWDDSRGMFLPKPYHNFTSHCFAGDTKVLTRIGTYQIMDLPPIGEVLTLQGWRQYQNPRITIRDARLVEVLFQDGTKVRCTPDHLFLTESGWRSARDLKRNSKIQSSSMLSLSTLMEDCTGSTPAKTILQEAGRNYIAQFGRTLLEIYLPAVMSTIRTATRKTIDSLISRVSMQKSTSRRHGKLSKGMSKNTSLPRPEPEQTNGTAPKRGEYGTAGWQNDQRGGQNGNVPRKSVFGAVKSLWGFSSMAKEMSRSIATPTAKPLTIEGIRDLPEVEDVWDITVPGVEHFSLENGAIVHNSADVHRYSAIVEDLMTIDAPIVPRKREHVRESIYEGTMDPAHAKPDENVGDWELKMFPEEKRDLQ